MEEGSEVVDVVDVDDVDEELDVELFWERVYTPTPTASTKITMTTATEAILLIPFFRLCILSFKKQTNSQFKYLSEVNTNPQTFVIPYPYDKRLYLMKKLPSINFNL